MRARSRQLLALFLIVGLGACSKSRTFSVGELSDGLKTGSPAVKDLWDRIPAYGISTQGEFEVNIEAEDTGLLRLGQSAEVFAEEGKKEIPCRVVRVLREASAETGQSLAWLRPDAPASVSSGQFVFASIQTKLKKNVLTVPRSAVLIRDGAAFVICKTAQAGAGAFASKEVKAGIASGDDVEIVQGLNGRETILIQGGLGFLYSDFKEASQD